MNIKNWSSKDTILKSEKTNHKLGGENLQYIQQKKKKRINIQDPHKSIRKKKKNQKENESKT